MKPSQRFSIEHKLKDKDWQKQIADYYRRLCKYVIDVNEAQILYKAASGILDEEDYTYVMNPLNLKEAKYKQYPARMRNYPIITPNLLTLLGEKSKRPINRIVIAINSDVENKRKQTEFSSVFQEIQKEFVNQLYLTGQIEGMEIETDENGQPIPPKSPEQIKYEASNLPDEMSILGQDFLEFADSAWEIPQKFRDMFWHWCVTGIICTYKDVHNDELLYNIIKPNEISVVRSNNISYFEDCECVRRSYTAPFTELDDTFCDIEAWQDAREELLNLTNGTGGNTTYATGSFGYFYQNTYNNTNISSYNLNEIRVEHIQWTGEVKIGKLFQEGGEFIEVDENYIPSDLDEIEWRWVHEQWEIYVIADKYYIGCQPLPLQRGKWDNPFSTKKNYNGRFFGTNSIVTPSIVKLQIPYQIMYNVVHYHLEKMMNKNKDKLALFPVGLIPENKGLDMFSTMYYADATGFLFIDETNTNAMNAMNIVKSIDLSLNQYLTYCYDLLRSIKQECDDLVGVTPQRKGEIAQSAGLGTTQEAIYRGSVMTEELFTEFDEYQEREYQGMLDYSPFICVNGKKVNYLTSDFKRVYREFWGEDLQQIQFGIKVKSSEKEAKKLETFRQWGFNFTQNGMSPSLAAKTLDADNFAKLTECLEEAENKMIESQQAAAQAQQADIEKNTSLKEGELEFKYYDTDKNFLLDRLNKLDDVSLGLKKLAADGDTNNNQIADSIERDKLMFQFDKTAKELKQYSEDLNQRRKESIDKLTIEREKIQASDRKNQSAEKIARISASKAKAK